ncbi:hypothetical protein MBBTH_09660 [Methanobrevibacter thaueri]|uniref:Uncharacterized protein n=2 Tax=Methanobrevibacter thaueri TaxID=190975 RepID=A0A315XM15_9EURY|nr:hypothetical protein MBBTH_09660 [Methanobrevibacter thaueri]
MALQLNVNRMKLETKHEKRKYIQEVIFCISLATLTGLVVYQAFLYFNIAIFGWNLGLIFAPLTAGYVETYIANKLIGEDIGAISAFILFAYTTFYSFILKNPTLGFNLITIGSIAVILQAAFPTLINYLIFTVGAGVVLYFLGICKKINGFVSGQIKKFRCKYFHKEPTITEEVEKDYHFDEVKSNELINSLDFYFLTSTDPVKKRIVNLGQFHATVIVEKATIRTPPRPKEFEDETLYNLKMGKDECLVKIANKVKGAGGNGIIDLDIQYSLIGIGGDSYQVSAFGMGMYLSPKVINSNEFIKTGK